MPKCVLATLVLSIALPSIAAAQLTQSASADPIRLAFVSPQRAFYESNDGKAAQARLASLESETSREVEARNARLKALQQELAEFVEDAQARFLGDRRDYENAFLAKFAPAVSSVAKKRSLLFVLNQDSGVLAWADPSLDITTDVVDLVNEP